MDEEKKKIKGEMERGIKEVSEMVVRQLSRGSSLNIGEGNNEPQ